MIRVLIVDPDPKARALAGILSLNPDYEIQYSDNPDSILDLVKSGCPDVIVLEVMLEGVDGLRVCKLLRDSNDFNKIGIIVTSRRHLLADVILSLDTGADDYMRKPIHYEELTARINAVYRRLKKYSEPEVLTSGDLSISALTHQVFLGDEEVHLSPRVFSLFHFLVRHKGFSYTSEDLMQQVWIHPDYVSNNVTVAIHCIRQAIEPDPRKPQRLLTIHGRYLFHG